MELDDCIEKRVSVRSYIDKQVSWDDLSAILNTAKEAPSSGNLQNWSFIIVQKPETKEEITKASFKQDWIQEAPVLIVVCSRMENIKRHFGERGEVLYSIQNCASAINYILLKATDLGLSTAWINLFDEEMLRRILNIPLGVKPQGIITLGYSNEKPKKSKRYDLDLLTHFEKWNGKRAESIFPIKEHKEEIKKSVDETITRVKNFSFLNKIKNIFKKKN